METGFGRHPGEYQTERKEPIPEKAGETSRLQVNKQKCFVGPERTVNKAESDGSHQSQTDFPMRWNAYIASEMDQK